MTYRRAPLAVPVTLPVITTITYGGRTRQIAWAEETVQVKDYGQARQITLSEHGRVALQILTYDFDACPADILAWLKSRWREENFLKYASQNYGIDKICDYLAAIEVNTKIVDKKPGPQDRATAAVREAEKILAGAERELAGLLTDPAITPAVKNAAIPALQDNITRARQAVTAATTARRPIPAKLPASDIDPDARGPRCCAPGAAACRWSFGSSPTTPSTGYATSSTPTCATTTNTAPSPARPSSAAWPAPSPGPPPRSPSTSSSPAPPASPAPWPCSSRRSTPPRPPCPATTAPSPTTSHPEARHLTSDAQSFAGDLRSNRVGTDPYEAGVTRRWLPGDLEPADLDDRGDY